MPAVDFEQPLTDGFLPQPQNTGEMVRFFLKPYRVKKRVNESGLIVDAELEAGRPVFEDRETVEIRQPGDRLNIVCKEVDASVKARYPTQYAAWKAGHDQTAASGMPLSAWPMVTGSDVEVMAFYGCRTVEQLASVSDDALSRWGGGYLKLRQAAKDWLAASKDAAAMSGLRAQNEAQAKHITSLEARLEKLEAALEKKSKKTE